MDIIDNSLDRIDSRDIIERLEALDESLYNIYECDVDNPLSFDEWLELNHDNCELGIAEYLALQDIQDQCENYVDDWRLGVTLIHEDYFTDYIKELLIDCGYVSANLPSFISDNIDWDGVAADCMCDYTEVDFNGVTYYVR